MGRQKQARATVRQVRREDYEELARFFNDNNRPAVTDQFHPFPLTKATAHQIARTDHLDRYYVAVQDGRVTGLCMLRGWDDGFEVPSFGILVDHRYTGLGLARRMTEFAMSGAARLGCKAIRLSVYASNTPAIHIYRSLGFKEASREPATVGGVSDMKIVMMRNLGEYEPTS